jgi:hypothetical protein
MRQKSATDRMLKRRRAEALLGPRGKLKFPSGYRDNDPRVVAIREWVIANRFPPWSVFKFKSKSKFKFKFKFFSIEEVTRAYNDRSGKGLDALRNKLDQDAISYARRFLSVDVTSWTKQGGTKVLGIGTSTRKDELRHAFAGIELVLGSKRLRHVPFIEAARDRWLPAVKRALLAREDQGHSTDSFLPHRQLIRQAVSAVCQRYEYRRSRSPATKNKGNRQSAYSIVAKAAELMGIKPKTEESIRRICSPGKSQK